MELSSHLVRRSYGCDKPILGINAGELGGYWQILRLESGRMTNWLGINELGIDGEGIHKGQ